MKKSPKIRVMVVDDHFVVRIGLAGSINNEPTMTVIAEAADGAEAVALYRKHLPDVILMDLRLPRMDGLEATAAICKEFPGAAIIILTTYEGDEDIYRALQAGARAYLLKSVQRKELIETVQRVHAGEHYLPANVASRLAARLPKAELSPRELQVLHKIVEGRSNKEIGTALEISELTVKIHVGKVLEKLQVNDRTQATTVALQRGLVHLD